MKTNKFCLCFLFVVTLMVSNIEANTIDKKKDDEVWKMRAEEAKQAARNAYNPNPDEEVNHLNHGVHKAVSGNNNTRRALHKYEGPCMATNPIDSCWRCDKNWARNRMKLADCVLGFGKKTTGGKGGSIYTVTDPSETSFETATILLSYP